MSFIAQDAANQDLHTQVYTVSLSNGTALDNFGAEFFSVAGVEVKGAGVEYGAGKITFTDSFETAKITFSTEKAALVLTLTNYVKPEKTLTYAFHGVGDTGSVAGILSEIGIVSSYSIVAVSDETAVSVDGDTLTALSFFEEVTLTVTLENESTVAVTNNYETVDIEVNKAWAPVATWPENVAGVIVQLQQSVNDANPTDVAGKNLTINAENSAVTQASIAEMEEGTKKDAAQTLLEQRFFRDLPKYDDQGNLITYKVVETAVTLVNGGTTSPSDFVVMYDPANGRTTDGLITVTNTQTTGSVQVTKTYSGVDTLPENFQITAEWGDEGSKQSIHLNIESESGYTGTRPTGVTVERTSDSPTSYTWTISGLPIGTVVTFTETNYTKPGYNVATSVNGNANVVTGIATVSAEPLAETAKVSFTNTYTPGVELPSTGGPGTVIYTAAGLSLMSVALWMILRRRKEQQN